MDPETPYFKGSDPDQILLTVLIRKHNNGTNDESVRCKAPPKTSSTGNEFSIWKLTDLKVFWYSSNLIFGQIFSLILEIWPNNQPVTGYPDTFEIQPDTRYKKGRISVGLLNRTQLFKIRIRKYCLPFRSCCNYFMCFTNREVA